MLFTGNNILSPDLEMGFDTYYQVLEYLIVLLVELLESKLYHWFNLIITIPYE